MHSSSLVLLAALVATSPAAFAVPTFADRMLVMDEHFAHAAAPKHHKRHALTHDQRWHALVRGQPSFADLSAPAPSAEPVVAAEPIKAPDQATPMPIPEPQTWALTAAGIAALGFLARRRRR